VKNRLEKHLRVRQIARHPVRDVKTTVLTACVHDSDVKADQVLIVIIKLNRVSAVRVGATAWPIRFGKASQFTRDDDLFVAALKTFADDAFVATAAVDVGGVEEIDAALNRRLERVKCATLVDLTSVRSAELARP